MTYKQNVYDFVARWHAQQYQPYDCDWHSRNELFNDWKSLILNFFSNMKCCVLSNFVRLSHHYHHFKRERNFYNDPILSSMGCMPYGSANCIMAENITNENGELMYICTKCDKQQHNSYKISYIAIYFSNYMISIPSIHPIHMQFFSLIDIGLHIDKRHLDFSVGQTSDFF